MKHCRKQTIWDGRRFSATIAALMVCLACVIGLSACQSAPDIMGPFAGEAFEEGMNLAVELADDVPVVAQNKDVREPSEEDASYDASHSLPEDGDDSSLGENGEREAASASKITPSQNDMPAKPDYSGMEYEEDVLLVSPAAGSSMQEVAAALDIDPSAITESSANLLEVKLPHGTPLEDAVETLQNSGTVESAQPNFIYYLQEGDIEDSPEEAPSELQTQAEEVDDETVGDEVLDEQPYTNSIDDGIEVAKEDESTEENALPLSDSTSQEADIRVPSPSEDREAGSEADADAGFDSAVPDSKPEYPDDYQIGTKTEDDREEDNLDTHASRKINDAFVSQQWALESVNAFDAWYTMEKAMEKPDGNVSIALFDEGFQMDHPDLVGNFIANDEGGIVSYNAIDESSEMSEVDGLLGHGTHVAGIVSAVMDNDIGIAGVSHNQNIIPVKVFDSAGKSSTVSLCKAYEFAKANREKYNIRVVNLSVGSIGSTSVVTPDTQLGEAIDSAYSSGIITVASAGDAKSGIPLPASNYPSDYDTVVSVMNLREDASNKDGVSLSSSSNYNREGESAKNISAPGTNIYSTMPKGEYGYKDGTSMAVPFVSGVFAMLFAVNPALSAQEAVDIVYSTTRDLGPAGFDAETGWGEVNAVAAVRKALGIEEDDSGNASTSASSSSGSRISDTTTEGGKSSAASKSSSQTEGGEKFQSPGISLASATVSKIPAYYYTGQKIKPSPKVSYKGKALALGTDYSLSYQDNKAIGTATVTVKGKGKYSGTKKASFKIIARPIYRVGASKMPIGSTSVWTVKHGSLKVLSGKGIVKVSKDGTVTAKKKGAAKVAIVDDAGRTVKTCKVKVYKLSGSFTIQSAKKANLALAVKNASKASNAPLVLQKLGSKPAKSQQFKFARSGSTYTVKVVNSGKYLAVKAASKKAGAAAVQKKKSGSAAQKWKVSVDKNNRLTFTNAKSGKVLGVKGTVKNGAKVVQQEFANSASQKWVLG